MFNLRMLTKHLKRCRCDGWSKRNTVVEPVKAGRTELDGARLYHRQCMFGACVRARLRGATLNAVPCVRFLLARASGHAAVSNRQIAACAATFSDQADR